MRREHHHRPLLPRGPRLPQEDAPQVEGEVGGGLQDRPGERPQDHRDLG